MKITRTDPPYIQIQSQRTQDGEPAQVEARATKADAQISSTAQVINQARSQLPTTSDVDMAKVNRTRQAISEGTLELDINSLSQAILDTHRR